MEADAAGQQLLQPKPNAPMSPAIHVQQASRARRASKSHAAPAVVKAQSRISSNLLKLSPRIKRRAVLLVVAMALSLL